MKEYRVTYETGGGTIHPDGRWTVKRTPKTITAEKISLFPDVVGVYHNHKVGFKAKIGKGTGNPMREEHEDGTFIVYFNQAGTPYYFEEIYATD